MRTLFEVGYSKNEIDFGVSGAITELSYVEMRELREMLIVGIGVMERMWGDAREVTNPPQQEKK